MNKSSDTFNTPSQQVINPQDGNLRQRLLQAFGMLSSFNRSLLPRCRQWQEKLLSGRLTLATAGQFSHGKTSLVNALLGEELLPVSVTPGGLPPVSVVYGKHLTVAAHYQDGSYLPIGLDGLARFSCPDAMQDFPQSVREIHLACPLPLLKPNIHLLDLPGAGVIQRPPSSWQGAAERRLIADVLLFLLSVDPLPGQADLDQLRQVRRPGQPVFFLLNKIDYLDEAQPPKALAYTRRVLSESLGEAARVYPVSAKLALRGRGWAGSEVWVKSRLGFGQKQLP